MMPMRLGSFMWCLGRGRLRKSRATERESAGLCEFAWNLDLYGGQAMYHKASLSAFGAGLLCLLLEGSKRCTHKSRGLRRAWKMRSRQKPT